MSAGQQAHALAGFAADVLEPLQERLLDAQRERCEWRLQWSRAEALEAMRFLGLGRVLGVFDADGVARARDHYQRVVDAGQDFGDAPLDTYAQGQLYRLDQGLRDAQVLPIQADEDDRRAWARACGLFRANVLVSSRLGHGMAAEALARLAFGDPMTCLRPLADLAGVGQVPDGLGAWLADAMLAPEAHAAEVLRHQPEAGLAASVFQATQYLWTLGFTHEEHGLAAIDGKPWLDPMAVHLGQPVAGALHLMQYWRLDLHRAAFERDLLEAVELMATIVFRCDETPGRSDLADGAAGFALDLRTRFENACRHWKGVFRLVPVGADQGDQGDQGGYLGGYQGGQAAGGLADA